MVALAVVQDVEDRLDFDLTAQEKQAAGSFLEDASVRACAIANRSWTPTDCPAVVRMVVLSAVRRLMINPDGLSRSRAGDEDVAWDGPDGGRAMSVYFTPEEEALIRAAVQRSKFAPTQTFVFSEDSGPRRQQGGVGLVPTGSGESFPMFAGDGPW